MVVILGAVEMLGLVKCRRIACMLERESVKIPSQECSSNVYRAVWIAASSARMIVLVSSHPVASM